MSRLAGPGVDRSRLSYNARMAPRLPFRLLVVGLLLAFAPAAPAIAQDHTREIAELRAHLQELRAELDALKALIARTQQAEAPAVPADTPAVPADAPAAPVDPIVAMLQEQMAEQAQVKVESRSRMPVTLSGTIVSNTFANSGEANWLENPNLVAPESGPTGSFGSTLRQTHLELSASGPAIGAWQASGLVAVDFLGGAAGFQTGTVMGLPRLRYALARLERESTAIVAGQDEMLLAPRDPTTLAAPGFPMLFRSGNLYLRAPQVRLEQQLGGGFDLRAGIVTPLAGDFGATYVFAPAPGAGERSRTPGVQARLGFRRARDERRSIAVGLSGHAGRERRASGTRAQWAAAVDWNLQAGRFGLGGEGYAGEALSAFGGALGQSVRSAGGFAEVRFEATPRVSFNAGGGLDRVAGGDRRLVPLRGNRTWFGNGIVRITPEVATSLEYRHLATETAAGAQRTNHHVNLTFAYAF